MPLAISVFRSIYWPGRYTIIGLAPLALLLGVALARSAAKPLLAVFCYTVLAVALIAHFRSRDINPETGLHDGRSDKAAAQFLPQRAQPGDALVFTSLSRPGIDYYPRRAKAESGFTRDQFPVRKQRSFIWAGKTRVWMAPAGQCCAKRPAKTSIAWKAIRGVYGFYTARISG